MSVAAEAGPSTKSAPEPVRDTTCGLPEALSVSVSEPERVPEAVGANVTVKVQDALEATLAPQVLIWEKSPDVAMLLKVREVLPVFFSVTV